MRFILLFILLFPSVSVGQGFENRTFNDKESRIERLEERIETLEKARDFIVYHSTPTVQDIREGNFVTYSGTGTYRVYLKMLGRMFYINAIEP